MTRLDILNGAPVYACLVEGNTRAEIVIDVDGNPAALRMGLTTLAHLLEAGGSVMRQARWLANALEVQEQERCRTVGTRGGVL